MNTRKQQSILDVSEQANESSRSTLIEENSEKVMSA